MAGLHSLRTRWAAIGAACAVTLGGGTLGIVRATVSSGERAIYVPISPVRVLDTRSGSKVVNDTLRLVVEGTISAGGTTQQVVPTDASAVAINVTATGNQKNGDYGFVTAFPCTSEDDAVPNASSLNFETGVDIANALNVTTSSNGSICLYVYGSAHLIVDVAGYYTDHNHDDRYYTKAQTYTQSEVEAALTANSNDLLSGLMLSTLVDIKGDVGRYSDIAIGVDGLPIISHFVDSDFDLRITHCENIACTRSSSHVIDGSTAGHESVGGYTSIAIGNDGLPIISHQDFTQGSSGSALRVSHCNDIECSSAVSTNVDAGGIGTPGNIGNYTSIAIGSDGFPVISHQNASTKTLRVTHCNDVACIGGDETSTMVDNGGEVGYFSSLAIGSDGLPVISHQDRSILVLRVTHCNNIACTSATSNVADNGGGTKQVGENSSLAIGSDGLPIVSHRNSTDRVLRVTHCNDVACAGSNETNTNIGSALDGYFSSIAIGVDGFAIISHQTTFNSTLAVTNCLTINCVAASNRIPTSTFGTGSYSSIAIGADGMPIISDYSTPLTALQVTHCNNYSCDV